MRRRTWVGAYRVPIGRGAYSFETAGLTPVGSLIVKAPRALECPVRLEAEPAEVHPIADKDLTWQGRGQALHVVVRKVHAATEILAGGEPDRIGSIRTNGALRS